MLKSHPEFGARVGEPSGREKYVGVEMIHPEPRHESPEIKLPYAVKHSERGQPLNTGDILRNSKQNVFTDLSAPNSHITPAPEATLDGLQTHRQEVKWTTSAGRMNNSRYAVSFK